MQSNWATEANLMGVFFDFREAFHTVDQEILLQKLHSLGVRRNVYALMASYLADRKHFVKVNSGNSNLQLVKGCPSRVNSRTASVSCLHKRHWIKCKHHRYIVNKCG